MDSTGLVTTLDGYSEVAEASKDDVEVATWVGKVQRLIEAMPASLELDWTPITEVLPDTVVDLDVDSGDRLAKVLEEHCADDPEATKAIDRWQAARPVKAARKSGGTREPKESDNPVWTLITITRTETGAEVHQNSRISGAISSLYFPAGKALRGLGAISAMPSPEWKRCREAIVTAAHTQSPTDITCGDFTVRVSF